MVKIVTIGGGTGAPTILRALIRAGFTQITAICTAMDSGGRTGTIRSDERDRVIAVSDLLRNLLALMPPHSAEMNNVTMFTEMLNFSDGRNRNLGYTIYYALLEKYRNDYLQVQRALEQLLGIQFMGRAIPITSMSASICFLSMGGMIYHGEHQLDLYAMSQDMIAKVWIEPVVPAVPEALEAIAQATHLIFCPGSLYGSVIANMLPAGVISAFQETQATKILISNLVSVRNETHNFTPLDYWRLFQNYTGLERPFDIMVVPDLSRETFEQQHPQTAAHYAKEYSYFLGWSEADLKPLRDQNVHIEPAGHYSLTVQFNRLRHDPDKLAHVLKRLII